MSTADSFLDELKKEYDLEFQLKSTLENKANYILIAAGVAISLLFSFGAILIEKLSSGYEYLLYVIIFLMIGVVTNIISVLLSVLGFSIKDYEFPFPYHIFSKENSSTKKLEFDEDVITKFTDGFGESNPESWQLYKESVIKNYLECNKINAIHNSEKSTKIKFAQWFFFGGAICIPLIIGFALPFLWTKPLP